MSPLKKITATAVVALSLALPVLSHAAEGASQVAQAATTKAVAGAADLVTRFRQVQVGDTNVFYREAGRRGAPTVLLLMGFGGSSYMFRDLIPVLATKYHVVAPDLPGFGLTEVTAKTGKPATFAAVADTIDQFTETLKLDRFAIYVFDYGAPTGYRIALKHPERITAIISQNGNAYQEGLSNGWEPIQKYWNDPSQANRDNLRAFMTLQTTKWQYEHGEPDTSVIEPEAYLLAQAAFDKPGNVDIQLDLFGDYKSNVALYPQFQQFFRDRKPPLLAIWGKNDPFFLPAGAEAYKRDNPNAEVRFLDAGHFALESHGPEISAAIMEFLGRVLK